MLWPLVCCATGCGTTHGAHILATGFGATHWTQRHHALHHSTRLQGACQQQACAQAGSTAARGVQRNRFRGNPLDTATSCIAPQHLAPGSLPATGLHTGGQHGARLLMVGRRWAGSHMCRMLTMQKRFKRKMKRLRWLRSNKVRMTRAWARQVRRLSQCRRRLEEAQAEVMFWSHRFRGLPLALRTAVEKWGHAQHKRAVFLVRRRLRTVSRAEQKLLRVHGVFSRCLLRVRLRKAQLYAIEHEIETHRQARHAVRLESQWWAEKQRRVHLRASLQLLLS